MLWSWSLGMHDGEGGQSLSIRSLEAGSARVRTPSCLLKNAVSVRTGELEFDVNASKLPRFNISTSTPHVQRSTSNVQPQYLRRSHGSSPK
jgi:hypothetical protein